MKLSPALHTARELHRAGRLGDAEAGYRAVLTSDPGNAEAKHLLGVLHCQRGELERAVALITEAIAADGRQATYHANLAVALKEQGRIGEALQALERAQALAPDDANVAYNIGATLQAQGRHADAIAHYQRTLAVAPAYVDAMSNLGHALVETGRPDEALAPLHRAVELAPGNAVPLGNLGLALMAAGAPSAGEIYLRRACKHAPGDARTHCNLGNVLHDLGRNSEAAAAFRQAIALAPDDADLHYNLGNALRDLGEVEDAMLAYGGALRCDPRHAEAWRNRLSLLLYVPGILPANRFAEHLRFIAAQRAAGDRPQSRVADDPDRPLRIAYLSSDFRSHPVARNLELLLAHRDTRRFMTFAYADIRRPDSATGRLRQMFDTWRDIKGLSDDAVAALIRDDAIDILVTLAGRFDRNRPLVASRRPAPIQVSFHDPATSGLAEMDYLIADRHLVPRRGDERFAERVLRLPSFYTHAPIAEAPDSGSIAEAAGRPLTLASFCHPAKLGPEVLALWGDILARLPGSRLQLLHHHRYEELAVQQRIRAGLGAAGAAASQVEFLADAAPNAHLALYRDVDVALDPFPFTGSTSTFEALSMGVPVVTLESRTMVGRWSTAMLRALKLDAWVAATPAAYVEIALGLAGDSRLRSELRRTLRARLAASPLCDGVRRARQVERLYRAIWRRWCAARRAAPASP